MKAYLAAGWFSAEQENARLKILKALADSAIDFYSPKEHGLFIPNKTDPKDVFDVNIKEIKSSDFIIASTIEKDMGTIFECGCAYILNKPIIYFWEEQETLPLNIMLSESSTFIATSFEELVSYLYYITTYPTRLQIRHKWEGHIE